MFYWRCMNLFPSEGRGEKKLTRPIIPTTIYYISILYLAIMCGFMFWYAVRAKLATEAFHMIVKEIPNNPNIAVEDNKVKIEK